MRRVLLSCLVGGGALLGGSAVMVPLQIGGTASAQLQPATASADDLVSQLGDRFEEIARKVGPAVVTVEAVKPAHSPEKGKPVEESGSGVLIRADGRRGYLVVTNNHVIAQARPEQITIHLADARILRPKALLADPETDIALLIIDHAGELPTAILGNSDTARVGRLVLAIGSPFGLNQTVTQGIISARERGQVALGNTIRIKDFLQTDAAINPGSSGGPLVNMRGEVIGINTAIASHHGSNSGVAFSIPINLVKRVMREMLQRGAVTRGYLGLQLVQSFEAADALKLGLDRLQGALVDRVYPDTPAAAAGVRAHDVILQLDHVAIRDENHLINLISTMPAGQRIRLQVWRNRTLTTLDAVVGDWSRAQARFRAE